MGELLSHSDLAASSQDSQSTEESGVECSSHFLLRDSHSLNGYQIAGSQSILTTVVILKDRDFLSPFGPFDCSRLKAYCMQHSGCQVAHPRLLYPVGPRWHADKMFVD